MWTVKVFSIKTLFLRDITSEPYFCRLNLIYGVISDLRWHPKIVFLCYLSSWHIVFNLALNMCSGKVGKRVDGNINKKLQSETVFRKMPDILNGDIIWLMGLLEMHWIITIRFKLYSHSLTLALNKHISVVSVTVCRDETDAWRWAKDPLRRGTSQAMVRCWSCHQDPRQYPFLCLLWTCVVTKLSLGFFLFLIMSVIFSFSFTHIVWSLIVC